MTDVDEIRGQLVSRLGTVKKYTKEDLDRSVDKDSPLAFALNVHRSSRNTPLSFKGMPYLADLYLAVQYDHRMVVKKSVQSGISELCIVNSHIEAGLQGLTVMYVLPKYELRNRFVNNRIYKYHNQVKLYKELVESSHAKVHRTGLMHFGKGTLVYVGSNVETEFLEIPIDSAYVDEYDRCNMANLSMLPDRWAASPYRYRRYISNPTIEGFGIDELYEKSSKGVWMIKDPHVKYPADKWFSPDFFTHVVEEVGKDEYRVLDPDYIDGITEPKMYGPSGQPVNRLSEHAEWVHENISHLTKGYTISQLFCKFTPLVEVVTAFFDSLGNPQREQVFFNSRLGRAYKSEGAKITKAMVLSCRADYGWPVTQVRKGSQLFMGVDVGSELHVVMRERVHHNGELVLRLVYAGRVPTFGALSQLIHEWKPRRVVIDAQPELHKVIELKGEHSNAFSSRFQQDIQQMTTDKTKRVVAIDHTVFVDNVREGFLNQRLLVPEAVAEIDGGDYIAQLNRPTRILDVDEERPEKTRYSWQRVGDDHYCFAEGYCLEAAALVPAQDVFDFYSEQADSMRRDRARAEVPPGDGLTMDQRERISEAIHTSPEGFLANLRDTANAPKKVKAPVDDALTWDECESFNESNGYVDVDLVAQRLGYHVDDVRRVLRARGFRESRIKGQYVR